MAEPLEYLDVQDLPRRKSVTFQELEGHSWSWDDESGTKTEQEDAPLDSPTRERERLRHTTSHDSAPKSGGISRHGPRSRSVIRLHVPNRSSPTVHRRDMDQQSGVQTSPVAERRDRAQTYSYSCPNGKPPRPTSIMSTLSQPPTDLQQLPMTPEETEPPDDLGGGGGGGGSRTPLSYCPPLQQTSRRNSFLYQSDTEDMTAKTISRTSSVSSVNLFSEEIVTPFAQILSTLYQVRSHFVTLTKTSLPKGRRRSHQWSNPISTSLSDDEYQILAQEALEGLDWCLHKLEGVNSGKSLGTMAQEKFERILIRELSHLSDNRRSGFAVAEWFNTLTSQDKGEEIDRALESMSTIQSHAGTTRARTASTAEPIPRFGVSSPKGMEENLSHLMSNQFWQWEFNAFKLNEYSGGQPLIVAAYTIFANRGFFVEFKMSKTRFMNFMAAVESNYRPQNPYHTAIHAADVLHATNYLLKSSALEGIFSPLEIMAALLAASVHDVDHPGRNNKFLVDSSHELALMYNDDSVLENHHLAVAFKLLLQPECNFLENLETAQMKALRRMMIDMVLATDMSKHFQQLGALKTMVETKKVVNNGYLVLEKYEERFGVLQCLIHCADLSNPAKPVDVAVEWATRVMEEQFRQGDEEKRLGLDIGPLCDRESVCIEQCQVTFIDYFLHPLWETWAELVFPDAQPMMDYLAKTREHWSRLVPKSPSPPAGDHHEEAETFEEGSAESSDTNILQSPEHTTQKRLSFQATRQMAVREATPTSSDV